VRLSEPGAFAHFDRRAIPREAAESRWRTADGHEVRRIDWPAPRDGGRGSILFLPGRGDVYEKYLETLHHWYGRGWRVTASDWRGQGGSGRLGRDPLTGHIDDFGIWIDDLALLWREWCVATPGPHVLIGHSMGGHLVLRALVERRVDPQAAVLVAPMIDLIRGGVPLGVMRFAARIMCALGDPRRPAWKWSEKPGALPADRANLLTGDPARYADELWWREARPEIATGPGSWGWVRAALASVAALARPGALEAVDTPVLLLSVPNDKLVSAPAIERAARRLPHSELLVFGREAHHELLREADPVRDRALAAIEDFLARRAPPGGGSG
jgi:lysophospholipase